MCNNILKNILSFFICLLIVGCVTIPPGDPIITKADIDNVTIEYEAWGYFETTLTQEAINLAEKHCMQFGRTSEHVSSEIESIATANEIHKFRCKGNTSVKNNLQDYKGVEKEEFSSIIQNAKEKCKKIGFKEKTKKFGNCVLQLIN